MLVDNETKTYTYTLASDNDQPYITYYIFDSTFIYFLYEYLMGWGLNIWCSYGKPSLLF